MTELSKQMHILLVCESLNTGGAERQVVSDANLLSENGWNVTLAYWGGESLIKTVNPNVRTIQFRGNNWLKRLYNLFSLCRRNKFQLIHSHLSVANFLSSVVGWLLGIPVIVTEHALAFWRLTDTRFRIVVPLTYKLARRTIAVCSAVRDLKISSEHADPKKTIVMYNCYSLNTQISNNSIARRAEYEIPATSIVVGFVGRLVDLKRVDLLLTIASAMLQQHPDSRFIIVGDGPCRQKLEEMTNTSGIADKVYFVGNQLDVASFYSAMDIFVLTSEQEALSIALIEAMASGLPAVVFDIGGNGEIVHNGKTGYIIPFDDCKLFTDRLIELACDESLRKKMGSEGKHTAEEVFSPAARLDALVKLYSEYI